MQMSSEQYEVLVNLVSPKVNFMKTGIMAFISGGLICAFGEFLRLSFLSYGLSVDDSGICVSVVLIFVSALLTGLGWFKKLAKICGAGIFVPITGFANAVVAPALEFKTQGLIFGVCSKMFTIAGPVIVYGVVSSMAVGAVFQLWLSVEALICG